jgi:hypothetical protein
MINAELVASLFFGLFPNHGLGGGVGVDVDEGCAGMDGGVCACSEDWLFFLRAIAAVNKVKT